jgi:hypothetical protein
MTMGFIFKLILSAVLILPVFARAAQAPATAAKPAANPYATPQKTGAVPAAVAPAKPRAAAAPTAIPGVYKTYQGIATPTPTPVPGAKKRRTIMVETAAKPKFSITGRLGLPAPFGETFPNYVQPLLGGVAEASYRMLPELEADIYYMYASFKYKGKIADIADKPLVANAFGLKAKLYPFELLGTSAGNSPEGFNVYGQIGMGMCSVFAGRAPKEIVKDENGKIIDTVVYSTDSGMDLVLGGGVEYQIHPNFAIVLDLAAHSVSLGGGTSDNLGIALFTVGGKYTF